MHQSADTVALRGVWKTPLPPGCWVLSALWHSHPHSPGSESEARAAKIQTENEETWLLSSRTQASVRSTVGQGEWPGWPVVQGDPVQLDVYKLGVAVCRSCVGWVSLLSFIISLCSFAKTFTKGFSYLFFFFLPGVGFLSGSVVIVHSGHTFLCQHFCTGHRDFSILCHWRSKSSQPPWIMLNRCYKCSFQICLTS